MKIVIHVDCLAGEQTLSMHVATSLIGLANDIRDESLADVEGHEYKHGNANAYIEAIEH